MPAQHTPTVSVVMPVYNGQRFLAEAIDSVLNQTFTDFEFIIVNDCSSDDSLAILESYARQDSRITIITNDQNLGESGSANVGVTHTRGRYIARVDQDDISDPTRFAKQVDFLDAHPDYIVVGTQAEIIDEHGATTGHKLFPETHEELFKEFGNFHPMLHPSIMVRKSLLPDPTKLWTNSISSADDYMSLFTLIMVGKFANLPEKLVRYRIHFDNNGIKNYRSIFNNIVRIKIYAIRELGYPLSPKMAILLVLQIIFVYTIPESLSIKLYMVLRGMIPLSKVFAKS